MDKTKPFLSTLFFLGLSFWGIQPTLAGTIEKGAQAPELFAATSAMLPILDDARALDSSLSDYALTLFSQVKNRAELSFNQALKELSLAGDIAFQTGISGLLDNVFQPIFDETNTRNLKAALPSAAWLFLSGILGVLGLKKRKTGINPDFV